MGTWMKVYIFDADQTKNGRVGKELESKQIEQSMWRRAGITPLCPPREGGQKRGWSYRCLEDTL